MDKHIICIESKGTNVMNRLMVCALLCGYLGVWLPDISGLFDLGAAWVCVAEDRHAQGVLMKALLSGHMPAGPVMYLVDHHHLARALLSLGLKECYCQVHASTWFATATYHGCTHTADSCGDRQEAQQPLCFACAR